MQSSVRSSRQGQPLGIYVHVPYCSSRCGYCDFNTYVPGEDGHGSRDSWREAALTEISLAAGELRSDRTVDSVFFGGGTPTLLPTEDLSAVLRETRQQLGISPNAEITVEANPETITVAKLHELLDCGINRLSLGMQSSDSKVLNLLDRVHTPGMAVTAAKEARSAGFSRVSLDLIYGTPGEDLSSWQQTLAAALDAGVGHISAYGLKVEPGTALHRRVRRGEIAPVDQDYAATAYEATEKILTGAGMRWYEISNWALPGHECRHNLNYWRGGDWWGIGPGAHSHMSGVRWWNHRSPQRWAAALQQGESPRAGQERLSEDQLVTEMVMLNLRLVQGLDPSQIRSQVVAEQLTANAEQLRSSGLLAAGEPLTLTLAGRRLADRVTVELLEGV